MLQNDYYLELPVSPGCPSCNSVCKVLKTTSTQGCFTDVTPILTHTGGDSNKVSRKINIVPERCIKKQSTNKSIQVRKPEKSFSQNHQSDRTSDNVRDPKMFLSWSRLVKHAQKSNVPLSSSALLRFPFLLGLTTKNQNQNIFLRCQCHHSLSPGWCFTGVTTNRKTLTCSAQALF